MYQESRLTQSLGAQIRHFCDNPAQHRFQEEIKWRPVTQAASQQQQKSITTLPRVQDSFKESTRWCSIHPGQVTLMSPPTQEMRETHYKCTKKTGS